MIKSTVKKPVKNELKKQSVTTSTKNVTKRNEKVPIKNANTVPSKNHTTAVKAQVSMTNVKSVSNTSGGKVVVPKVVPRSNILKKPVASEKNVKRTKPVPLKATMPVPISKANVMNKVHNVTVLSPPVKKKDVFGESVNNEEVYRERTKTRTLEPHEIVIFKNIQEQVIKKNTEPSSSREISLDSMEPSIMVEKIKDPVSFEINFDDNKLKFEKEKVVENEPDDEYEDDFESYESDFESGSSSEPSAPSTSSTSPSLSEDDENLSDNLQPETSISPAPTIDIIRDESKLDSGNYDLHSGLIKEKRENQMNSIEEDSGIDNFRSKTSSLHSSPLPCIQRETKLLTQFDKRGQDLMKKIQLDTMSFQLFELKPMTYEYYMKIYGNMNAIQNSTQTNEDVLCQDTQTDDFNVSSIWTQFPPRFSNINTDNIYSKQYYEEKHGVGDGDEMDTFNGKIKNDDLFLFQKPIAKPVYTIKSVPTIDHDRLNMILQRSSLTIFEIIDRKRSKNKNLNKTNLKISNGFSALQISEKIKTYGVYTNHMIPYTFVTVHDSNSHDFTYVASVWTVSDPSRPIQSLSSWSQISCIEIHPLMVNVVIAGLNDGSISAWDMRENSYWHSQSRDKNIFRVPSQVVVPSFIDDCSKIEDFGRVVAIKSVVLQKHVDVLKHYNPIQICSLHEIGYVTIWTILESQSTNLELKTSTDHISNVSPWSKIRLIQSASIDLREYFKNKNQKRPQSSFEKKRSYFENNIFSDDVLQELHEHDDLKEIKFLSGNNLQFNDIAPVDNGFFIAMNKNYLLFCTKSLKLKDVKKILVDDKFITVASLQMFNINKMIGIGLSDGSIKIFSCNIDTKQDLKDEILNDNFTNEPSSSSSANYHSNVLTKSCAIQNIIEGERKMYDSHQAMLHLDNQEIKQHISFGDALKQFKTKLNSDDILFSNFSIKNQSVKKILLTKDERILFAIVGDRLMVYDLLKNDEIDAFAFGKEEDVKDIGLMENESKRKYLIICNFKNENQIHEINDELFI